MKIIKFLSTFAIILGGVLLLGLLFAQPLFVFSQEDAGVETPALNESETAVPPAPAIPNSQKLDETLLNYLAAAEAGETLRYIVHMADAGSGLQAVQSIADPETRRVVLVEQLQQTAQQSQQALLNDIQSLQQTGSIQSARSLWIINAVAVAGTVESVAQLAQRPDVARITLDEARPLITPPEPAAQLELMWKTAALAAAADKPWGIDRVRAPYAWQGLGVDGSGITVGIMDSGVDWQHPDLLSNYRGNLGGGAYEHSGNWYDAVVPTMTVPHDVLGHGTHVAGTAIGQNGIGVAPGASWIAVSIANEYGMIYDSDAHAGFQWLLAPDNNPALAPDVVNGSWSGPGYSDVFLPDIQALDAAGIITVFAAGNSGPEAETIGAPASFTETIAVGAQDDTNAVTWFSSRGPSPHHDRYQPQIIAPGAAVYSSLPDGEYGYYNGTSMAAPHTTGAVALILAADDTLSRQEVTRILTETAVPISSTHPNMDSGWGRLDAYQAVAQATSPGVLSGLVHENGQPLPGVVVTITTGAGADLVFVTDENGRYTAQLQPGSYQLATAPFGFQPVAISGVNLTADNTTTRDLALTRLPSGTLIVQVVDADNNLPVQATIDILETPLSPETAVDGTLNIQLPAGDYDLRVSETGYKIANIHVTLSHNQTTARTVPLTPAKKVLLVDTGAWYYRSYRDYFGDSLNNLGYAYDTHVVTNPAYPAFPDQTQINEYDVLVWTAPSDSPGYIGANNVITDFLGQGGNLLISGQNVGAYDGYGFFTQVWWYRDLQASFMGETAVTHTITGAVGTNYAGMSLTLNGSGSADNQADIDVSRPRTNSFAEEIFYADGDMAVGLQAGHCKPFRLSYLGFGLEGVTQAADRDEILAQSFAYFDTPRQETGLLWRPESIDDYAPPGEELVYPVQIQHLGELITDTYALRVDNAQWPVALSAASVELGPCRSDVVTITVQVPAGLPRDLEHDFTITAVSQNNPSVQVSLPVHHKTPGHILLVDDDRWYDQEAIYRAALTDTGFSFDEWDIGWDNNVKGSPPLSLLNAYNFVIWYTGYDWFAPITDQENQTLAAYIDQGGRLFLSSQDFLYYNHTTPMAQTYLGILEYQESITPTHIYRGHQAVPPNLAEPMPLTFQKFKNNGDGLTPGPYAEPFVWHDQGMAAGVANSNPDQTAAPSTTLYRTVFFGFPFEKLPVETRAPLMGSVVGWLSDLGDSSFAVDQRSGNDNDARTYTITLRNNPLASSNQTSITNTLPVSLTLQPATLTGGATYDAPSRQMRWQGQLASGEVHTITYQAIPSHALPDSVRIDNPLTIAYAGHGLTFDRTVAFWINAPDLSPSVLAAASDAAATIQYVTYTLSLQNSDVAPANKVTATLRIPASLTITGSAITVHSGQLTQLEQEIVWAGDLLPGEVVTITVNTSRQMSVEEPEWVTAVAYLQDNVTNPLIRSAQTYLPPYKHYFPVIARNE